MCCGRNTITKLKSHSLKYRALQITSLNGNYSYSQSGSHHHMENSTLGLSKGYPGTPAKSNGNGEQYVGRIPVSNKVAMI